MSEGFFLPPLRELNQNDKKYTWLAHQGSTSSDILANYIFPIYKLRNKNIDCPSTPFPRVFQKTPVVFKNSQMNNG